MTTSGAASGPLEGLDLVEHQDQPGVARVAQDGEQAPEEAEGGELVDVPLDPGRLLGRAPDMRLPRQPGDEAVGGRGIAVGPGTAVAPQGRGELGRGPADRREPLLQQGDCAMMGNLG